MPRRTPAPPQNVLAAAIRSPFPRMRALIEGMAPGREPIDLTIGEPKHTPPAFYLDVLNRHAADFGRYPPIAGTPELRQAIAAWLERRYRLEAVDPDRHVLPLNGSREGLFSALFVALDRREKLARPAVIMPNPFYQAYLAAALGAGCEPVMATATEAGNWLPDLDALAADADLMRRTVALYLCSPANPQGAVASAAYLEKAIRMARQNNFILLADECYSEIYAQEPPPGALDVVQQLYGDFSHVIALNSLSKRSSLPGLRSGFCAGDADFIARFTQFRNVAAPQTPLPVQAASAALWADETHVVANRMLYQEKFQIAEALLGTPAPAGGFFLWLDVARLGGSEKAAVTIWQREGVKVLPGAYLSFEDGQGNNPGASHVRIALVTGLDTTEEALRRISRVVA